MEKRFWWLFSTNILQVFFVESFTRANFRYDKIFLDILKKLASQFFFCRRKKWKIFSYLYTEATKNSVKDNINYFLWQSFLKLIWSCQESCACTWGLETVLRLGSSEPGNENVKNAKCTCWISEEEKRLFCTFVCELPCTNEESVLIL